jgi:hypothetical protein
MNPTVSPRALAVKRFFQILLICPAFAMKFIITPSVVQSPHERNLGDKIPKHRPVKFKIKAEKKNLQGLE